MQTDGTKPPTPPQTPPLTKTNTQYLIDESTSSEYTVIPSWVFWYLPSLVFTQFGIFLFVFFFWLSGFFQEVCDRASNNGDG